MAPFVMGCWWPNKKPFQRAARWDGIMPNWPAMTDNGTGPQGEQATGSVEEELRALLDYYRGLTDNPGMVILPDLEIEGYRDLCRTLGADWLLTTHTGDLTMVQEGPPT